VLIVDDEPSILSGLRMLLHRERKTWDMVFALGGGRAWPSSKRRVHVVVTDMRMPKLDGPKLLQIVTELAVDVPDHPVGTGRGRAIMHALPYMHVFSRNRASRRRCALPSSAASAWSRCRMNTRCGR
jgi:CheY-like chemotaxis protein